MNFLNGYYVLYDAGERITQPFIEGTHLGIDFGWNERYTEEQNYNVYAQSYGTIIEVVDNIPNDPSSAGTLRSYGNYVVIDHGNGYKTRYAHLAIGVSNYSQVGQIVTSNSLIGIMGNTGYSSGTHLHFEVYYNDVRIDPTPYITTPINPFIPPTPTTKKKKFPWFLYWRKRTFI